MIGWDDYDRITKVICHFIFFKFGLVRTIWYIFFATFFTGEIESVSIDFMSIE